MQAPTATPPAAIFPTFPTVRGKTSASPTWTLPDELIALLQGAYPAVDVLAACRLAHAWAMANPAKRKTAKGMEEFLRRWMEREQNRPRARGAGYGANRMPPRREEYADALPVAAKSFSDD